MNESDLEERNKLPFPKAKAWQSYRLIQVMAAMVAGAVVVQITGFFINADMGLGEVVPFGFILALSLGLVQLAQVAVNLTRHLDRLESKITVEPIAAELIAPADRASRGG